MWNFSGKASWSDFQEISRFQTFFTPFLLVFLFRFPETLSGIFPCKSSRIPEFLEFFTVILYYSLSKVFPIFLEVHLALNCPSVVHPGFFLGLAQEIFQDFLPELLKGSLFLGFLTELIQGFLKDLKLLPGFLSMLLLYFIMKFP